MRTFRSYFTILVTLTCVASFYSDSADAQWLRRCQPTDCQPSGQWVTACQPTNQWYMEFGGRAFDRPGADLGIPLVTDSVTLATVLDSDDITDIGGGTGGEVKFGFLAPTGTNWEFRTSIANWDNDGLVIGTDLTSPLTPGLDPDQVGFEYESEYYSIELNKRRCVRPGVTLLAGPRIIVMNEDLDFNTSTVFATPGGPFQFDTSNTFSTNNTLLGGQIGAEFNIPITQDIYATSFIRVGGFANPTKLRLRSSTTTTALQTSERTKFTGSFVGEVGGKIYVSLVPNKVSSYLGYDATWTDGIALAPAQSITVGNTSVHTGATPFWHSVNFGFRFDF